MKKWVFILSFILGSSSFLFSEVTYLVSLRGEEFEMGNLLEWTTLSETNSQLFSVEKSVNGIDFTNIGEVKAAGFSSVETTYNFLDIQATEPIAFYRLKQIDSYGTGEYSHTILIKKVMPNQFFVRYINTSEVKDKLEIHINAHSDKVLQYEVVSNKHAQVSESMHPLEKGENLVEINFENVPAGIYQVHLKSETESEILVVRKIDTLQNSQQNVASIKKTSEN